MSPKKPKKPFKKVARNKLKYPTFHVARAVSNRKEELECDYIDKLNESEKDWLNRFNEETVCANFQHRGELLDKSDEYRKECFNHNNRRNRDILRSAETVGLINRIQKESDLKIENIEDVWIEIIDLKKEKE